jgi:hypothetical protein
MPEATINENYETSYGKNEIGLSNQISGVQCPASDSSPGKCRTQTPFG